jgi:hypothetical protein
MHVIRHTADGFGHTIERANHSAKVGVQPVAPRGNNEGFVVLGAKDEVIMETEMGG